MRRNSKPKSNSQCEKKKSNVKPPERRSTNDPSWYASDAAILRDAASIPFSWSLGTSLVRNNGGPTTITSDGDALPGILRMDLHPVMGLSVTADSALNTASVAMYSYVRHANSGHSNYDAPDLMLYCGAMAQVYAYINWCQRLYGCATMYAQKNRYIPKHLLVSMGVDPDSIVSNLANFRYWINVMVAKAASLAVPATMSYFSRTAFLYSNIYCESEQIKDQLYYYHPASWLKFEFNSGTKAGHLKRVKLAPTSGLLKLPEIQSFGEELLGSVLQDEDMNIMSGDILKAYGTEGIIKLSSIPEILDIFPIYDPFVLEQIHNATVMHVDCGNVDQDPDNGFLMSIPTVDEGSLVKASIGMMNKLLSVDKAEPAPEDVIESSRLMLSMDLSRFSANSYYVGCGSEIADMFTLFRVNKDGSLGHVDFCTDMVADYKSASMLKYFKYAPSICFVNNDGVIDAICESIDNYAVLSSQDVYKLHDVALMNMFAVPSVAKVTRV